MESFFACDTINDMYIQYTALLQVQLYVALRMHGVRLLHTHSTYVRTYVQLYYLLTLCADSSVGVIRPQLRQ